MSRFDIGNGSIWLGDCLELMKQIPDGSVDCVVTDPPYKVISGGTAHGDKLGFGWEQSVLKGNNGKIFKHNNVSITAFMTEFYRILKDGTHCYVMINNKNLRELLNVADKIGFGFHNLLDWKKNNATANRWYMKDKELCLLFYKKPAKRINDCGSKSSFPFDNPRNKAHPTEKPVELMQYYIENSSQPGDLILDPFSGSGATAVAAERSGRRWIAIEKDPEYYIKSVGRLCGETL